MPRLLTKLRISEVSAVDKGAGENCEIMLMKRHQDVMAKATAALEESVASIINCDDDDETKRDALAETFTQFQMHLDREITGKSLSKGPLERETRRIRKGFEEMFKADDCDDITKASGAHHLTQRLLEHLTDALERKRERHGFEKASTEKEPPMNDSVEKIAADHGVHALAKLLVDDQSAHQIDEHRFVRLVTSYAKHKYPTLTEAKAFQAVFLADDEAGRMLQRAHQITKSATAAFDVTIVDIGDETHRTVNDTEQSEAYQTLEALAAKLHEAATGQGQKLTKEQAFARAFEQHPELARAAHRTPVGGSTHYPMPNFNLLGSRR
jgi:hypothetical protein